MEIILLERIEKLGFMGDIVTVKNGYARNFLLPKKKALRASKENKAFFEAQQVHLEADNIKARSEAEKAAKKVDGKTVTVLRKAGDSGQLYGSVTAKDIAEALQEAGITVQDSQIILHSPIKMLGLHRAKVMLHPEVSIWVVANVAKTAEEAQARLEEEQKIQEQTANKASDQYKHTEYVSEVEDAGEESEQDDGESTSQ